MFLSIKKKLLNTNRYLLAVILFLTATCLHMLHSVLIKNIGLKGVYSTYEIIFIRSAVVFLILFPFFITKKVKFIEKQNFLPNILFAGLSIIASYCWHYGLSMISINNAVTINFLMPMILALFATIFLKEKLSRTLIISIIICFSAIVYFYKPNTIFSLGYLLLIVDLFCYSSSIILSKKLMMKKQSPITLLFFKVMIILITSFHVLPSLTSKITAEPSCILPSILVGFLYMCESLLFFTAYMLADVSKLQPLYYTRIVFGALISYLILGELLTTTQIIVASIIIVVNANLIRTEKKK